MFFIFSKLLDFIISPLVWIIILFAISIFSKSQKRKQRFFIGAFTALLFFTNPFIVNRIIFVWEIHSFNSNKITQVYDVGIVMGGAARNYNSVTQRLVYGNGVDRILQAVELYRQQKIKKILLSGGSGLVLMQEAKESFLVKKMLLQMNIPDSDIIVEDQSRNTFENALMTAAILKTNQYGKRYVVITSALHIRRTLACFHKQGIAADVFPVDEHSSINKITPDSIFIPDAGSLCRWDLLIHEWVGLLTYKVSGYI